MDAWEFSLKGNKQWDKTVQTARRPPRAPGRLQEDEGGGSERHAGWDILERPGQAVPGLWSRSWHSCSVSWNWRQASSRMELLLAGARPPSSQAPPGLSLRRLGARSMGSELKELSRSAQLVEVTAAPTPRHRTFRPGNALAH